MSTPRGLLIPAFKLYRLSPDDPPQGSESRLLWDIGRAVHRYVDHLFSGGVLCPFSGTPADKPAEHPDEG